MSDRLAVLVDGKVEQIGTPSEVYSSPATAYVAGFLGSSNLYDAVVLRVEAEMATSQVGDIEITGRGTDFATVGASISVVVRPERIEIAPPEQLRAEGEPNVYAGTVAQLVFLGAQTHVRVELGNCLVVAEVANVHGAVPEWLHEGRPVCVRISTNAAQLIRRGAPAAAVAG